ncbi:50S ribosomal protein L10 [Candidatus Fermentibacteria bacterium]|nr:MAG: 50S ribosomal protein L10 [Candidatus Fermentibacteria bacterium]
MSITRNQKETVVSTLNIGVDEAGAVVLADFTGINVEQMTELRRQMREAGITFKVVKNTLLRRALENIGVDSAEDVFGLLNGPTAIAYSKDEVAPARLLKSFSKEHKGIPAIKGGFVSGRSFNVDEVMSLADMPSREELLAKVLGSANAPVQGFVMVTSGVIRKFLYAVNAISESKEN